MSFVIKVLKHFPKSDRFISQNWFVEILYEIYYIFIQLQIHFNYYIKQLLAFPLLQKGSLWHWHLSVMCSTASNLNESNIYEWSICGYACYNIKYQQAGRGLPVSLPHGEWYTINRAEKPLTNYSNMELINKTIYTILKVL